MAKAKPSKNLSSFPHDGGLFRVALGTAAEPMALFDREGSVVEANPAFIDLLGLSHEQTIGRDVSLIFARDFVSMARERFTEQFDTPHTPSTQPAPPLYETTMTRPDGEERVMEVYASFVQANDQSVALLVSGHDVTERKRTEQALSKNWDSYRTLVQNLPNGLVLLFDRDFTILVAGGASFSKLGLSSQDMIGKKIFEALSQEELKQVAPAYEAVLDGMTTVAEVTRGDQIYEVHHEPLFDEQGMVTGGMVLSQNITFRKRSEAISRRLALLVESSNDAIIGKMLDGTIYSWNGAAERLYGYSADEIVGRSVSLLMPAERPDEMRDILDRIAAGEKIEAYDTVRLRKDGSSVHVSLSVAPVLDASRQVIGASTIARDISERKVAERAIREYAVRQIGLQSLVTTAQEGERRRLAMELHDGPLQSLAVSLIALDRARARTDRGEPDLAKQEIAFARGVLGEITMDVRGVLANLSAEMLTEQGLAVALRHHAELVSEGSDIQVTVDDAVHERLTLGSEVLLYRLVQEAVANARKHSQARHIDIRIGKEMHDGKAGLRLAIRDDGIGFDPEEGLKRRQEGSGLGLRSMQQRIESAGGNMKITSAPGLGTTVGFWCPI